MPGLSNGEMRAEGHAHSAEDEDDEVRKQRLELERLQLIEARRHAAAEKKAKKDDMTARLRENADKKAKPVLQKQRTSKPVASKVESSDPVEVTDASSLSAENDEERRQKEAAAEAEREERRKTVALQAEANRRKIEAREQHARNEETATYVWSGANVHKLKGSQAGGYEKQRGDLNVPSSLATDMNRWLDRL